MPKPLLSPHTEGLLLGVVGAGEIQTGRVGREGRRQRPRKGQKRENKGQIGGEQQSENRVQLRSQPEQGRLCGLSEVVSEMEEGVRS